MKSSIFALCPLPFMIYLYADTPYPTSYKFGYKTYVSLALEKQSHIDPLRVRSVQQKSHYIIYYCSNHVLFQFS